MHERYLINQSHEQSRQRLSSNTSSSNSSNSSSNSAIGEETEGLTEIDDSKKKKVMVIRVRLHLLFMEIYLMPIICYRFNIIFFNKQNF